MYILKRGNIQEWKKVSVSNLLKTFGRVSNVNIGKKGLTQICTSHYNFKDEF